MNTAQSCCWGQGGSLAHLLEGLLKEGAGAASAGPGGQRHREQLVGGNQQPGLGFQRTGGCWGKPHSLGLWKGQSVKADLGLALSCRCPVTSQLPARVVAGV